MITLEHESHGNARQCMRYVHAHEIDIAYAPDVVLEFI